MNPMLGCAILTTAMFFSGGCQSDGQQPYTSLDEPNFSMFSDIVVDATNQKNWGKTFSTEDGGSIVVVGETHTKDDSKWHTSQFVTVIKPIAVSNGDTLAQINIVEMTDGSPTGKNWGLPKLVVGEAYCVAINTGNNAPTAQPGPQPPNTLFAPWMRYIHIHNITGGAPGTAFTIKSMPQKFSGVDHEVVEAKCVTGTSFSLRRQDNGNEVLKVGTNSTGKIRSEYDNTGKPAGPWEEFN